MKLEIAYEALAASDGNKLTKVYICFKVRGNTRKTARVETHIMILELDRIQQ